MAFAGDAGIQGRKGFGDALGFRAARRGEISRETLEENVMWLLKGMEGNY